jgi:hypothetical protein
MAKPKASVSASRWGEMPCRSQTATLRFIEAVDLAVILLRYQDNGKTW